MGRFSYDGNVKADFDDRVLAHLQVVISQKLRRGETFTFTWRNDTSLGDGRTAIWLHPHASIVYSYHGSRQPALNRAWLDINSGRQHVANNPFKFGRNVGGTMMGQPNSDFFL